MQAHTIPLPKGDTTGSLPYLTEHEAARYLSVSVHAMRHWRKKGRGPLYSQLGRLIRYRLENLDAFMAERMVRRRTA